MKLMVASLALLTLLNSVVVCAEETSNPEPAVQQPVENPPVAEEKKAVIVDYFGGYTGYDSGGYQLLRSALGQMIADGTLGTFLTQAIGKSGGGTFCVELSPYSEKTVYDIAKVLASLSPADRVTVYRFQFATKCVPTINTHKKEIVK